MTEYEAPKRYFLYGPTLTGKTLFAKNLAKQMNQYPYRKMLSGHWKNYTGQKVVYIENLQKDDIQYIKPFLEDWLGYYRFECRPLKNKEDGEIIKDGFMIDPEKYTFIITSKMEPEYFFNELDDELRFKLEQIIETRECNKDNLKDIIAMGIQKPEEKK